MPSDLPARAAAILAALRELERVCEEATGGEWEAHVSPYRDGAWTLNAGEDVLAQRPPWGHRAAESVANVRAIVAARTALPVLVRIGIAEVEATQKLPWYDRHYAQRVLDRWSAILPQPKEGEHV